MTAVNTLDELEWAVFCPVRDGDIGDMLLFFATELEARQEAADMVSRGFPRASVMREVAQCRVMPVPVWENR